jgi:hypothetical protein
VVVVHRAPQGSGVIAPPQGHQRPAFGADPLDQDKAPRSFRRAIDRLMGDIADKLDRDRELDRERGRDRDEDRS